MAKLNEGDIIEGIFAIAVAYLLSEGKVNKGNINVLRTKIEPSAFASGSFTYSVAKGVQRKKTGHPPDTFNVNVSIRLKAASVTGAFGKEYKMLYSKSKDIGKIDKKIDSLIESADPNRSNFAKRLLSVRDKFLENNQSEIVTFDVIADGIAGEASGGDVKGDVMVNIEAVTSKGRKSIFKESLPFSIKSESITVANLSPYTGMINIAKALGLKWDDVTKFDVLKKRAVTPAEKNMRFLVIVEMYKELKEKIRVGKLTAKFSDKAYSFLEKSIFGSDLAEVVDIRTGGVKEITISHFNYLKTNVKLDVDTSSGEGISFVDKSSRTPIFKLRVKLRRAADEAKFYLEVGKGIYSVKEKLEEKQKAKTKAKR